VLLLGMVAPFALRLSLGHFFPATQIDAVEIDGELSAIGERFFDLRLRPELHLITADARPWLAASTQRYDAIFVDAYRQPYIPSTSPRASSSPPCSAT
jgi:spermidine synthase